MAGPSFQSFIDKYELTGIAPGFIAALDASVGSVLTAAWAAGTPVAGQLGAALGLLPGSMILMPFLEADITPTLALIMAGLPPPGVPAALLPISPVALLGLVSLNPSDPNGAKKLANALLDWAVAQAPPLPAKPGAAAPWPPMFVAV